MIQIDKTKVIELIESTKGKIFHVVFTKKDGSERKMTCRLNVQKHLKGGKLSFDPAKKGLIGVFDMHNGYRFINLNKIKSLTINKVKYENFSIDTANDL